MVVLGCRVASWGLFVLGISRQRQALSGTWQTQFPISCMQPKGRTQGSFPKRTTHIVAISLPSRCHLNQSILRLTADEHSSRELLSFLGWLEITGGVYLLGKMTRKSNTLCDTSLFCGVSSPTDAFAGLQRCRPPLGWPRSSLQSTATGLCRSDCVRFTLPAWSSSLGSSLRGPVISS